MIQRVQTDKVVAVSTVRSISSLHPFLFNVVVSSLRALSPSFTIGLVRFTEISHRTFIKFRSRVHAREFAAKTKINESCDPTLTHYRQVLCSLSQKINGTALFRIRVRHHFFRSSASEAVALVQCGIDFYSFHRGTRD